MPKLWLAAALLAHLVLATTYAWRAPAWEGPDENDHAYYASFLQATGHQPTILRSSAVTGRSTHEEASLGHHPPLYYALLGGLTSALGSGDYTPCWSKNPEWPAASPLKWQHGRDEVGPVSREVAMLRCLRFGSVLLGAASIALTFALARTLFADRPGVAGAAAVTLAVSPQWSWMHGVLDNGNLATTLTMSTLLVLARALRAGGPGPATGAGVGLLLGAALLTKLTALFLLPVVLLAYALALRTAPAPGRSSRRSVLASLALALGLAAATSGAWFWRNASLYGDPLALRPHAVAYETNRVPAGARLDYLAGDFLVNTLHSAFAGVGWSLRRAPPAVEVAASVLVVLALLGLARRPRTLWREGGAPLQVALAALVLTVAGLVQFNLTFVQPQGRYLFPAFGVGAILAAAGLAQLPAAAALGRALGAGAVLGALALQHAWFLPMLAAEPVADPRYASYYEGLRAHVPEASAQLEALGPPEGVVLDAPPTFRWHDRDAGPERTYSLVLQFPDGFATATWEGAHLALTGEAWTLPPGYWAALPAGQPIGWRVRRIADRARGEAAADQPTTATRTFVKRR